MDDEVDLNASMSSWMDSFVPDGQQERQHGDAQTLAEGQKFTGDSGHTCVSRTVCSVRSQCVARSQLSRS